MQNNKGCIHITAETDPYRNLAVEECLLSYCREIREPILYLWQNDNTIVLGRNQNPYSECNMDFVHKNSVKIARRTTGGGAVYHDLGNLNYSFIYPRPLYSRDTSLSIVESALKSIGIPAYRNGRNDICVDEKKVSGNAFFSDSDIVLHHGTILVESDIEKINEALCVSDYKLVKHSVPSVAARVSGIHLFEKNINIESVKDSIRNAFAEAYGISVFKPVVINSDLYERLNEKHGSREWIFGKYENCKAYVTHLFDWGEVTLWLELENQGVKNIEITSDSLDTTIANTLKANMIMDGSIISPDDLIHSFDFCFPL